MERNVKMRALALKFAPVLAAMMAASLAAHGQSSTLPVRGQSTTSRPAAVNPSGTKVGLVNIQEAIVSTNEGKQQVEAFRQKFAPKEAALKKESEDLETLKQQLQVTGDKLSPEDRNLRVQSLEEKQKTLQRNYDDAQSEAQRAQQEVLSRLGKNMLQVVENYARKNGYAVILDVSNPQTPVLYADPATVITKQLVDAYNAEHPATAPAAKQPAAGGVKKPATGGAATLPVKPPPAAPTPKKP
jgi:outer membrane protein